MLTATNRSGTMDEKEKKKTGRPHLAVTYEFNCVTGIQSRTSHFVKGKYSFETCACVCLRVCLCVCQRATPTTKAPSYLTRRNYSVWIFKEGHLMKLRQLCN